MKTDLPPPSLLRSPLLWLGLMVLAFLGWAWRDSATRWAYAKCGPVVLISQASGVTALGGGQGDPRGSWYFTTYVPSSLAVAESPHYPELIKPRFARPGIIGKLSAAERDEFSVHGKADGRSSDPMILWHWEIATPVRTRVVFIPHWCLMLAVLLPWLGLIYWMRRRIRRHLRSAP